MKKYVVIARFDDNTNQKMLSLRDELMSKGYSVQEWPPHITIAAYENCDEESIKDWISEFVKSHHQIEVGINSITILPPAGEHSDTAVLCFAPTHKKDFVDFYYEFHDKLDEYRTGIGYYYSKAFDNPIFHSSIGVFNVDCLKSIMNMIFSSYAFGLAKINALELYTYPMQLIERYELTK